MTSIEERLTRIEAHLGIGKAEQPPTKERTFEAFYVDCTREEYPEVKAILEAQGYRHEGGEWMDGEDCVVTTLKGHYTTFVIGLNFGRLPVYTLPQLREKFGMEQPQEQLRDFVVPLRQATLTREEVAARCVAAARTKGYHPFHDEAITTLEGHALKYGEGTGRFFDCDRDYGYCFVKCRTCETQTLEAFEEYCGVVPAITATDFRVPASQMHGQEPIIFVRESVMQESEQPKQPVYEAGFSFHPETFLQLPDKTILTYDTDVKSWVKDSIEAKPQTHTLTPVSHHTAGRFYALAGIYPNHLSDWRSYALCVKNEDVPHFVRPTSEYGIVSIDRIRPSHVSLNEVTPA